MMGSCLGHNNNQQNSSCSTKNSNYSLNSFCFSAHSLDKDKMSQITTKTQNQEHSKSNYFIYRIMNFKKKKKGTHFLDKYWLRRQEINYTKLNNGLQPAESILELQMHNLDVTNLLIKTATAEKESSINGLYNYMSTSRASSSLDLEWEHEYGQMRNGSNDQPYQHLQQQLVYQNSGSKNIIVNRGANNNANGESEEYWPFNNVNGDALSRVGSIASITDYPPIYAANKNYRKIWLRTQTAQQQRSQQHMQLPRHNGGSLTRNSSCNSWSHMSTSDSLEWDIDEEQQQQLLEQDDNLDDDTIQLLHQIEELKTRVLDETGVGLYTDYTKYLQELSNEVETTNLTNSAIPFHSNHIGHTNNYNHFTDSDQENANCS